MVDPLTTRRLSFVGLYLGLAALLLFVRLLPLSTLPTDLPGPDILLCLTFAWLMRRPDFLPVLAIVAVFALEDMLLMRPPGLWALVVLIVTEILRDRTATTRDMPFLAEWMLMAICTVGMLLSYRLVLALVMVPQAGLGLSLLQLLATIAAYPIVAWATQSLLGLRRVAPGDLDALGNRI